MRYLVSIKADHPDDKLIWRRGRLIRINKKLPKRKAAQFIKTANKLEK